MSDAGRYDDLNKAHDEARKAQEAHGKAETARQEKLREQAAAAKEAAATSEKARRLGYETLKQAHDDAHKKQAEQMRPVEQAPMPAQNAPQRAEVPAVVSVQQLATPEPRQPTQFFTIEGNVAAKPAHEAMPSRPIDKRQADYARHRREEAHQTELQAIRSEKLRETDPREHAREQFEVQQKRERDEADRERRALAKVLEQTKAPPPMVHERPREQAARQRSSDEMLRPSGPASVDRPETGRLSEASPARPARAADTAREVTDAKARRQNEDARPKSDKEALLESLRANHRAQQQQRERGGGGGRER